MVNIRVKLWHDFISVRKTYQHGWKESNGEFKNT